MSHLGRAWSKSITKECWNGFKRSVDHNPILGMCFVMLVSAIILPQVVPPFREIMGYPTSQFTKKTVVQWRLQQELSEGGEDLGDPAKE